MEIELTHQIGTMGLDGLNTQTQDISNLFAAPAFGHQIENVAFAVGQGAAGRRRRRRARVGLEKAPQDEVSDFRCEKGLVPALPDARQRRPDNRAIAVRVEVEPSAQLPQSILLIPF